MEAIKLRINGRQYPVAIEHDAILLHVIRSLGLTGTKEGCGKGECGACTVLLDGLPINSCLYLAVNAQGKDIITIEGMAEGGRLHPLQEAFLAEGAVQCGYCSPGMLLTGKALLDKNPNPTEEEIRTAIAGNLCRCTGYAKIVKAIQAAARKAGETT